MFERFVILMQPKNQPTEIVLQYKLNSLNTHVLSYLLNKMRTKQYGHRILEINPVIC